MLCSALISPTIYNTTKHNTLSHHSHILHTSGDQASSAKIWSEVKSQFKLEPTDQSTRDKKKRKQYWSDFDVVSGTGEGFAESKTDVKIEEGEGGSKQPRIEADHVVPVVLSEGNMCKCLNILLLSDHGNDI